MLARLSRSRVQIDDPFDRCVCSVAAASAAREQAIAHMEITSHNTCRTWHCRHGAARRSSSAAAVAGPVTARVACVAYVFKRASALYNKQAYGFTTNSKSV